jgi:hypothetical protein
MIQKSPPEGRALHPAAETIVHIRHRARRVNLPIKDLD